MLPSFSRIPTLSILALLVAFVPPSHADDLAAPERLRWSAVELEGSKLFITAKTRLSLEEIDASELGERLASSPRGRVIEPSGEAPSVWQLGIETSALGRRSSEAILFDGRSVAGLQRFKLRHGSKTYTKTYRYTDTGVSQLRAAPVDVDEATGPRDRWTKRSETWYAHPATGKCATTLDAGGLIYLASARSWQKSGEALELCVFSSKTFSRLELRQAGTETVKVDHRLDEESRKGSVNAIKLELTPSALLEGDDEPFEMLGLQGKIQLLVDPELGLPLEIRGKLSPGGPVTIRLRAAELRP